MSDSRNPSSRALNTPHLPTMEPSPHPNPAASTRLPPVVVTWSSQRITPSQAASVQQYPATPYPHPIQELTRLAPLLANTPLPFPQTAILPSIREVFPIFPPELPRLPPRDQLPDISSLFALLLPRNPPTPPFSDDAADQTVRLQVCATCGSSSPTMACPSCHLLHYCSSTTCLLQDPNHQSTCTRYNKVSATVYAHPYDHSSRYELVQILEDLFKRQRTQHLLQMAIWHRNEIMRLSPDDPMRIHLEFPYNLLRTGENDAVVSFVHHCVLKSSRAITDSDRFRTAPGDRMYPVNFDRYEDPLEENYPPGIVPLTHLVALCLVKIRIIASMNARICDDRHKAFWASNFGKKVTTATGMRLEDFFVRGGRSREIGHAQVTMLTKYLLQIRQRNPIMEYVIRDAKVLQSGPPIGYEASFGEAKGIWEAIGDLFMQIPAYPSCVF